jgi:hypothetical protein
MIDRQNMIFGMLLFPFGNLSHTSILYYILLYAELEYNFFTTHEGVQDNVIHKVQSGYSFYARNFL